MSDCTLRLRMVRTRKPHRCIYCWAMIPVEELCSYWVGVYDGKFNSNYGHVECQTAFEDDDCEDFCPGDYPVPERIREFYSKKASE